MIAGLRLRATRLNLVESGLPIRALSSSAGVFDHHMVVASADTRAKFADIRPVDMDRDCHGGVVVGDLVDVARWGQRHDRTDVGYPIPYLLEHHSGVVQPVACFELFALMNANHTPRHVVVDTGFLTLEPDERDNRKGAIIFDMENMLTVSVRVWLLLLDQEEIGVPEMRPEDIGNPFGHVARRLALANDRPDFLDQLGESRCAGPGRSHCFPPSARSWALLW